MKKISNAEFVNSNTRFIKACKKVTEIPLFRDLKPTKRQASKWRMGKGAAYKNARFLIELK